MQADLAWILFNFILLANSIWFIHRFFLVFFDQKPVSVTSVGAWLLFILLNVFIPFQGGYYNIILILTIFLIVRFAYVSGGVKKYFLIALLFSLWGISELFAALLLTALHVPESTRYVVLGSIMSKLLMNLWVYIISMFSSRKKGDYIPRIFYFYMMIITVGSSYVALLLYRSHTATVFSISILLLFHMVFIEIYLRINEHFLMEQEKEIYMRQLALNESSVSQQRHSLQEFYAERQQLIEKLLLIKKDIEQGRMATVEEDLESFIHNGLPSETISNCGNSTIDSVINFKHAAAKEYGIAFDLKLFVSTQLPFEPCDLGILIGNALDNAIEATKQCTRAEKTIHVSMQIKKESFIMVMKNPFEGELKKDPEGRLLTTGKHPQRHGYGLRSIMRIAEKYDGETIIRNDNGCFVLTVILNLNLSGDFCLSPEYTE